MKQQKINIRPISDVAVNIANGGKANEKCINDIKTLFHDRPFQLKTVRDIVNEINRRDDGKHISALSDILLRKRFGKKFSSTAAKNFINSNQFLDSLITNYARFMAFSFMVYNTRLVSVPNGLTPLFILDFLEDTSSVSMEDFSETMASWALFADELETEYYAYILMFSAIEYSLLYGSNMEREIQNIKQETKKNEKNLTKALEKTEKKLSDVLEENEELKRKLEEKTKILTELEARERQAENVKKLRMENYELRKQLDEIRDAITEQNAEPSDPQETDLNTDQPEEQEEEASSVSMDYDAVELPETGIVFVGGHVNLTNKLRELFPKWTFLSGSVNANNIKRNQPKYAFIWYKYMSHPLYNAVKQGIDVPIIYLQSTNMDKLILEMKERYFCAENKKEESCF